MKMHPLINSFAAGEISPYLHMRDDLPAIRHGAKTLENVFTNSQGSVFSRRGSEILDTKGSVSQVAFLEFEYTDEQSFVLVFIRAPGGGNGSIMIFESTGFGLGGTEQLSNPDFDGGTTGWTLDSSSYGSATYYGGNVRLIENAYIPAGQYAKASVHRSFTVSSTGTYLLRVQLSAFYDAYDASNNKLRIRIGTAMGSSPYEYEASGNILSTTINSGSTEISVQVSLTASTTYYISVSNIYAGELFLRGGNTADNQITFISLKSYTGTPVSVSTTLTDLDVQNLRGEMVPGEHKMYVVGGYSAPHVVEYNPTTDTWSITALTFTAKPSAWATGNYPTVVTFYQGRSWWSGVESDPETFWGSKSGSFLDMTTGTAADDALEYTITKKGPIQWICGANTLMIGTSRGEFNVIAEGGVIIPGDIDARPQSRTGSRKLQALNLGNKVIFVNLAGDKVHDLGYNWKEEQWIAREISYVSEHLFSSDPPKQLAFVAGPRRMIVVLTESGHIHTCVYDDNNNIIGWHRHSLGFTYNAIASCTINGISYLYAGYIDGQTDILYVENINAEHCLEHFIRQVNATPSADIDGITFYASEEVSVIADGVYIGEVTLDASGDATLSSTYSEVIVGKKYTQTIRTLPGGLPGPAGSGFGMEKSWNRIFLRLYNSYIPKINGIRPRVKRSDSEVFEVSTPVADGFIEITELGFDEDGTILIEQDEPHPICITGIYGEMTQEKL